MALHDFRCLSCGYVERDLALRPKDIGSQLYCPRGGDEVEQIFAQHRGWAPFEPYWDQHINENPVYIESAAQRNKIMDSSKLEFRKQPRKLNQPFVDLGKSRG